MKPRRYNLTRHFKALNEGASATMTPTFARVKVEKAIKAKDERIMGELETFFKTQKPGYSGIFYGHLKQHGIVCPHLDSFVKYLMDKGFNIDSLSALEEKVLAHEPQTLDYDLQVGDLVTTYNRSGEKVKGEIVAKKAQGLVCVRYRQDNRNIVIWRNEDEVAPIDDAEIAAFSGYGTNESYAAKSIASSFLSKYSVGDEIEMDYKGKDLIGTIIDVKRNLDDSDFIPVATIEDNMGEIYELILGVRTKEWFIDKKDVHESVDSYKDDFRFRHSNKATGIDRKPRFGETIELDTEEGKQSFVVKSATYDGHKLTSITLMDISDYYDLTPSELSKLRAGGEVSGIQTYVLEIDPSTGEMYLGDSLYENYSIIHNIDVDIHNLTDSDVGEVITVETESGMREFVIYSIMSHKSAAIKALIYDKNGTGNKKMMVIGINKLGDAYIDNA